MAAMFPTVIVITAIIPNARVQSKLRATVPIMMTLNAVSGGKTLNAPGGVLIRDQGGKILGAVGVTGDISDRDEACAIAGIQAVGLIADTG